MDLRFVIVFALLVPALGGKSSSEKSSSEKSSSEENGSPETDIGPDGYRFACGGNGVKYCKHPWTYSCPSECKKQCSGDYSSGDSESESEWDTMRPDLKAALSTRIFDQAFIDGEKMCVSNCKRRPGCDKWVSYMNDKYCMALKCGGGIDGCHNNSDFSKMTCKACRMVFPKCRDL